MKQEADSMDAERVEQHMQNKVVAKQTRREDKLKKRRLNVEIASEIIDLIVDVADESYDYQMHCREQGEEEQITKEVWRKWMQCFEEGNKVSELNIVINKEESQVSETKETNPLAIMLGAGDDKISPSQILDKIQNESIFNDFMQYLSMCGPLNLNLVAPE